VEDKRSFSYSKLKLYQECPRAYKFEYIDKIEAPFRKIAIIGKLAHQCFHTYTEYLMKKKLRSDITIMPQVAEKILAQSGIPDDEELMAEVKELAERFTRGFVLNLDTFYGSEIKLAIDEEGHQVDWKADNAFFRGILDRIDIEDNRVLITDYKTGWEITKDRAQLETYAWMAKTIFPQIDTFYVEHYFVRYNVKRYSELSTKDIERAERRVRRIVRKIQKDKEFSPTPSARCSWCPYVVRCAQLPTLRGLELPLLDSEEKAKEYAGKLLIVEEALKRVKQMLKEYCKKHGGIDVGDGVYGFHFTESPRIKEVERFMHLLWDKGEDPLPYLTVNMRKAKPLLEKIPELQEITEAEGKTQFRFKRWERK